ncbi:MAG: sugar-binding transcriptional regulator [Roseiarcus sp.]|jgi:DNA-binding transcriptional regulator LsrR (DeoR family)
MKVDDDGDNNANGKAAASGRNSPHLRHRIAWMYYVEEMTQSAIADRLGIGRITVGRMLAEARAANEVRISVSWDLAELTEAEIGLQKKYDIREAIVVPLSTAHSDPRPAIAAATGNYISDMLRPNMKIGLGWGQTLLGSLPFLPERQVPGLAVVSLLGGITRARQANPAEFAAQFARFFLADCYLLAAPAIVDSAKTKETLIERCGLSEVYEFSKSLDAVVVGVGSISPNSTASLFGAVSEADNAALRAAGAVGDMLFNFFDIDGNLVDHSLNKRTMSIPIETISAAPLRVLVAGGINKVEAMLGAFKLFRPTVLITDEFTANALLKDTPSKRKTA